VSANAIVVERVGAAVLVRAGGPRHPDLAFVAALPTEPRRTTVVVDGPGYGALRALDPGLLSDLDTHRAQPGQRGRAAGGLRLAAAGAGRAGSDGSPPLAAVLADRLEVEVVAPDGHLLVLPGGGLFSAEPAGGWWAFRRGRRPRRDGPRHPAPTWQSALPEDIAARAGVSRLGVLSIPAGLWIRPVGAGPAPLQDWAYGVPCAADRLALVVGAPTGARAGDLAGDAARDAAGDATDVDDLARILRALPGALRASCVVMPYGPQVGPVPLAQRLADRLGGPVRCCHGLVHRLADGRWCVAAVSRSGQPGWRPFVTESVYHPGAGAPVPVGWVPPAAGMTPAGPASYGLVAGWVVDVVPGGLLVRPAGAPAEPLAARLPVDPEHVNLTVTGVPGGAPAGAVPAGAATAGAATAGAATGACGAATGIPGGVLAAVAQLARALPDDARAILRLMAGPAEEPATVAALAGLARELRVPLWALTPVGPLLHAAAPTEVGPLPHAATTEVSPLPHAATTEAGPVPHAAAPTEVGPLPHAATAETGPLPHAATAETGPLPHAATAETGPLPHAATAEAGPLPRGAAPTEVDQVPSDAEAAQVGPVPCGAAAEAGRSPIGVEAPPPSPRAATPDPVRVDAAGRARPAGSGWRLPGGHPCPALAAEPAPRTAPAPAAADPAAADPAPRAAPALAAADPAARPTVDGSGPASRSAAPAVGPPVAEPSVVDSALPAAGGSVPPSAASAVVRPSIVDGTGGAAGAGRTDGVRLSALGVSSAARPPLLPAPPQAAPSARTQPVPVPRGPGMPPPPSPHPALPVPAAPDPARPVPAQLVPAQLVPAPQVAANSAPVAAPPAEVPPAAAPQLAVPAVAAADVAVAPPPAEMPSLPEARSPHPPGEPAPGYPPAGPSQPGPPQPGPSQADPAAPTGAALAGAALAGAAPTGAALAGGPLVLPPGHRSTPEDRQRFRSSLGWRYDAEVRSVARLLAERPGLRAAGSLGDAVMTELVAAGVFARSGQADVVAAIRSGAGLDASYVSCLAAGLRLLPALQGVVVRGGPADPAAADGYRTGTELVEPAPVVACGEPDAAVPGAVEVLIWSVTARRLDGLAGSDRDGEVAFGPGTVFRVLGVQDGHPRRVLLTEIPAGWARGGAAEERRLTGILARLEAAAAARAALPGAAPATGTAPASGAAPVTGGAPWAGRALPPVAPAGAPADQARFAALPGQPSSPAAMPGRPSNRGAAPDQPAAMPGQPSSPAAVPDHPAARPGQPSGAAAVTRRAS
jgi:hypothetical protein